MPDVRQRIRALLRDQNVQYGVCSAARGADLIFLSELLQRGGTAQVVLPFPVEAFKRASVGSGWDERLDELLRSSAVELLVLRKEAPAESEQPKAFAECNRTIEQLSVAQAGRFDQSPLLIAVWDGVNGGGDGGTGDFVKRWREDPERRLEIIQIKG